MLLEKNDLKKQEERYFEERKMQVSKHATKILQSARKKNAKLSKTDPKYVPQSEITLEKVLEARMKNIPPPKPGSLLVQIHLEYPFINDLKWKAIKWEFPKSQSDKVMYTVFKDLWLKNYFVTSGLESGMDYMLYKGDPLLVHAVLGVVVIDNTDIPPRNTTSASLANQSSMLSSNKNSFIKMHGKSSGIDSKTETDTRSSDSVTASVSTANKDLNSGLRVLDLVSYVRVNNFEKRKTLLAFVRPDFSICYQTVKWEGNK